MSSFFNLMCQTVNRLCHWEWLHTTASLLPASIITMHTRRTAHCHSSRWFRAFCRCLVSVGISAGEYWPSSFGFPAVFLPFICHFVLSKYLSLRIAYVHDATRQSEMVWKGAGLKPSRLKHTVWMDFGRMILIHTVSKMEILPWQDTTLNYIFGERMDLLFLFPLQLPNVRNLYIAQFNTALKSISVEIKITRV